MKIVVGSVLSRYPLVAGSVVNRLNFVVGLRRLGHEVFLVEEVDGRNCVDADGGPRTTSAARTAPCSSS